MMSEIQKAISDATDGKSAHVVYASLLQSLSYLGQGDIEPVMLAKKGLTEVERDDVDDSAVILAKMLRSNGALGVSAFKSLTEDTLQRIKR